MAQPDVKIRLTADDKTRAAFASAQKNFKNIESDARKLQSTMASLGLSIGAAAGVRGLARMADEFSSLQARLKLASRDVNEFNAANADLVRISSAAQAPLSETATLYTRIAASVKDLDVSQRDIASTTEAVALSLKISGASAAEASSAMLQFSQAIASGVLRGEEFNAITEAAPRLLQAVAASLKVPVGSLREMAKEGQLTRDVLINGLLAELPKLQQEAATLPKTIGAAFTDLNNKLLLTVGEMNKVTGATNGIGEAITSIGKIAIETFAVLGANVAFVFKGIGREIGGVVAQISRLAVGDFQGFSAIGRAIKQDAVIARKELDDFEKRILGIGQKASATATASVGGGARPLPGIPDKKPKSTRTAADPLAGLLGSTDIGKLAAFDKQVALLNSRFDGGRKSTDLYNQAMTKLVETTFAANFAEFNKDLAEQDETQRLVAEHLKATNDELFEQQQSWIEVGKALEEEMRTPLENANIEFGRLQDLLDRGVISWETYARAVTKVQDAIEETPKKFEEMDSFAKKFAENAQDSFADFFKNFDKGTDGMLQKFGETIKGLIAEAVAADLAKYLFGDLVKGGSGSGATGGLLSSIGSLFGFADGGIAAYGRPVALPRFAGGGISNSAAIFGEAGPEAAVPLPDGRRIPVEMRGGGGHTVNVYISGTNNAADVRNAGGQVGRSVLSALEGARRYG